MRTRFAIAILGAGLALTCLVTPPALSQSASGQPGVQRGAQSATAPAAQPELPGSLKGASIARPLPADAAERERVTLTFLAMGLSDEHIAEARAVAPNVRIVQVSSREQALEHAAEADGADGRLITPEFLATASHLRWVHSPSAGVERLVGLPGVRERADLVVTNAKGVHGPAIADHAMGMLLSLTRQLPHYHDAQERGEWSREAPKAEAIALQGRTMLIVGIGGIGSEIAQRAHAFGMRIIATRRSDTPAPDYVERVGKPQDLAAMLPEADVVAICVPLTPETESLFDDAMIRRMKPGAYVINIARGRIINTDALIAALNEGRIAGAALDVTDPEPLPAGHALWSAPNVLITPHVAADGELTDQRWWALYKENLRRFGAGEPLLNCVDVAAGY